MCNDEVILPSSFRIFISNGSCFCLMWRAMWMIVKTIVVWYTKVLEGRESFLIFMPLQGNGNRKVFLRYFKYFSPLLYCLLIIIDVWEHEIACITIILIIFDVLLICLIISFLSKEIQLFRASSFVIFVCTWSVNWWGCFDLI